MASRARREPVVASRDFATINRPVTRLGSPRRKKLTVAGDIRIFQSTREHHYVSHDIVDPFFLGFALPIAANLVRQKTPRSSRVNKRQDILQVRIRPRQDATRLPPRHARHDLHQGTRLRL